MRSTQEDAVASRADASGDSRLSRRVLLGSAAAATAATLVRPAEALASGPQPAGAGASVVGTTLSLNVRASAPALVRGRVWPVGNSAAAIVTPWQATNRSDAASFLVPGVSPTAGAWAWRGEITDPTGTAPIATGAVRRVPAWPAPGTPAAFAFAFGSCITHLYAAPSLSYVPSLQPMFYAHLGDMDYVDFGTTPQNYALYSKWFRAWLNRPEVAPLVRICPIMGIQDDHDYGLDSCWANTWKTYAAAAYADVIPGAQYPNPTYRSWRLGEVDVWMLDNRRYKDPKGGPYENGQWMSVLRSVQRTWLLDGLAALPARVKVVLAPMTVGYYWSAGEKALVYRWIASNVTGTVVFCTGDRHQTAFVNPAPNVWELLASPLNNPKKTLAYAIPGLVWVEHPGDVATSNVVGVIEVDTSSATSSLTMRAITDDGSTLHAITIPV